MLLPVFHAEKEADQMLFFGKCSVMIIPLCHIINCMHMITILRNHLLGHTLFFQFHFSQCQIPRSLYHKSLHLLCKQCCYKQAQCIYFLFWSHRSSNPAHHNIIPFLSDPKFHPPFADTRCSHFHLLKNNENK